MGKYWKCLSRDWEYLQVNPADPFGQDPFLPGGKGQRKGSRKSPAPPPPSLPPKQKKAPPRPPMPKKDASPNLPPKITKPALDPFGGQDPFGGPAPQQTGATIDDIGKGFADFSPSKVGIHLLVYL